MWGSLVLFFHPHMYSYCYWTFSCVAYVSVFLFPQLANFKLIQSHSCEAVYQHSQTGNWILPTSCSNRVNLYYSISVTLMSRLMLNLHQAADAGLFTTQGTSTNVDYNFDYETPSIPEAHPWRCWAILTPLFTLLIFRLAVLWPHHVHLSIDHTGHPIISDYERCPAQNILDSEFPSEFRAWNLFFSLHS